jgi:hypothetical protein
LLILLTDDTVGSPDAPKAIEVPEPTPLVDTVPLAEKQPASSQLILKILISALLLAASTVLADKVWRWWCSQPNSKGMASLVAWKTVSSLKEASDLVRTRLKNEKVLFMRVGPSAVYLVELLNSGRPALAAAVLLISDYEVLCTLPAHVDKHVCFLCDGVVQFDLILTTAREDLEYELRRARRPIPERLFLTVIGRNRSHSVEVMHNHPEAWESEAANDLQNALVEAYPSLWSQYS